MSRRYKRRNDSGFTLLLLAGTIYYTNTDLINSLLAKAVLVLAFLFFLSVIFKFGKYGRSSRMAHIDYMSGVEFERYLVRLLRKQGYKHVRMTEKYDLGIDIIAQKDGITLGRPGQKI